MRYLALVLAVLTLAGCSAFQTSLTWPHDAGGSSPKDAGPAGDAAVAGGDVGGAFEPDAATSLPDAGCPPCVLGSANVGECCLQ